MLLNNKIEINEISKINKNKRYYIRTNESLESFKGFYPLYEEVQ